MQVARPRVVAQAAPQREHVVEVRPGEGFHIRETREEALVVRNDRRDLGLLQHHFRQPDAIRIARPLPRQVMTPVPGLPAYEPAGESAHRLRRLLSRSCTRSFSSSSALCFTASPTVARRSARKRGASSGPLTFTGTVTPRSSARSLPPLPPEEATTEALMRESIEL